MQKVVLLIVNLMGDHGYRRCLQLEVVRNILLNLISQKDRIPFILNALIR